METRDKYIDFLIIQAQNGRKNPFLELVDLYKEQVFLLSLKLTGNLNSADKITNEVFSQAWKFIKLINQETPLELWLHGLTISLSLADYRKIKTEKNEVDSESKSTIVCQNPADEAFLKLGQVDRNIVILHDLEGYSIEDISEIIDEKDNIFIAQQLSSARKILAEDSTFQLLSSLQETEWVDLISDFDTWNIKKEIAGNVTEKLKQIIDYRLSLAQLLNCNLPTESSIDSLKKSLFDEGQAIVEKQKEENLKSFRPKSIKNKREIKKRNKILKDISTNVASKSSKKELSKIISHKNYRDTRKNKYLAFTISIVIVFSIYIYSGRKAPKIEIISTHGGYTINEENTSKKINVGDEITTRSDGEVTYSVGEVVKLTLNPDSRAFFISNSPDSSKFQLVYGKIALKSKKSDHILAINTRNFSLIDDGSHSLINLDKSGKGEIRVKKGRVYIKTKIGTLPIFKNYVYNSGDIVPHYSGTSAAFLNSLKQITLPLSMNAALKQLLIRSTEKDALTLWCLLDISGNSYIPLIFDKLNSFYPIIGDVTESGIMYSDKKMMNTWLEDIDWQMQ